MVWCGIGGSGWCRIRQSGGEGQCGAVASASGSGSGGSADSTLSEASDLLCTYLCSYVHICTDHNVHTHTHTRIYGAKESEHPGTHTLTICVYRFQSNTRASTDKFYLQTFHLICKRVAAPSFYTPQTTHSKPDSGDSCKCVCVCQYMCTGKN